MLIIYLVFVLHLLAFANTAQPRINSHPIARNLWNFGRMGKCVLGYNPFIFNHYGCWCGMGGGHEPVDENDRCCKAHDKCYDDAVDSGKCIGTTWQYVSSYDWKCENHTATCAENQSSCKAAICACDLEVVNCWNRQPRPKKKKTCHEVYKPRTTIRPSA